MSFVNPEALGLRSGTFVTGDGVRLSFFEGGNLGAPVLVLVSAFETPLEIYARLIKLYSAEFRVLACAGRSAEQLPQPLQVEAVGLERRASDVAELLQELGARRKVHVVGWCSAAHVAHRFSRRHPELVASTVLANAPYFYRQTLHTDVQLNVMNAIPLIAQGLDEARAHIALMQRGAGGPPSFGDATVESIAYHPYRSAETLLSYARASMDVLADGEERYADVAAGPALVIGGRNDRVAHFDGSRRLANERAATKLLLNDGDHFELYVSDAPAHAIAQFAAALEAGV